MRLDSQLASERLPGTGLRVFLLSNLSPGFCEWGRKRKKKEGKKKGKKENPARKKSARPPPRSRCSNGCLVFPVLVFLIGVWLFWSWIGATVWAGGRPPLHPPLKKKRVRDLEKIFSPAGPAEQKIFFDFFGVF